MLDWVCQTNEKLRNSIPSLHSEIFKKLRRDLNARGPGIERVLIDAAARFMVSPEMTSFFVRFDPTTDSMIQLENKFRTKWNRILELLSQGKSPECN